jgi:hypothetical protein
MIAGDGDWLKKSPHKLMTLAVAPVGCLLLIYIKLKLNGLKDERTD